MNGTWTAPSSCPSLVGHEAHVWLAHLPSARGPFSVLAASLSGEESERARRFRFDAHRERWQLTRGILRALLAAYLGTEPRLIAFREGPHGKPALAHDDSLRFNTSHSGDYAAFAMTRLGDVGVDLEQVRDETIRGLEIARRYFAPGELSYLESLPEQDRTRAFFDCWTRKEAFVKARGDGLFSGLDQFEVAMNEPRLLKVTGDSPENWWLTILPPVDGYAGAMVVKSKAGTARFWKWDPAFVPH